MNVKKLKNEYTLDSINDECTDVFLKLKLFKYNIDNISYFKEHTEKEYLKYLYKNVLYFSSTGLFLGQLDKQDLVIYILTSNFDTIVNSSPFFPLIIIDKNDKNIKFKK